ncbi:hypothetical protein E2F43_13865 [Seongchinamella unica]|uniref:Spondin domain-containing protein n=1 Tax=Seongchinamella unica TaxID=2547392 RepID=A0A4R5LQB1_9GAMM|nr:spondin domain-containing protein [Seongchinamella unica]TDG12665.1 hypothetical protein E2F43_13865 [Seongchinamella unica]
MFKFHSIAAVLALGGSTAFAQGIDFSGSPWVFGGGSASYEVTLTNMTPGQTLTPQLLVTHAADLHLFELGQPASMELEILAEGGDTMPLADAVVNVASYVDTVPGLLPPGASVSAMVMAGEGDTISMAAMLIPTNDTFAALDSMALPAEGSVTYYLKAYDAGTEANDQNCRNIPGPTCGGEGYNGEPAAGDEGFVHVSNGFHRLPGNTLRPNAYDWRNPVARVIVTRR